MFLISVIAESMSKHDGLQISLFYIGSMKIFLSPKNRDSIGLFFCAFTVFDTLPAGFCMLDPWLRIFRTLPNIFGGLLRTLP